jgi:hypothetical protein
MLRCMRTTVRLPDDLLRAAKLEAARRGATLTALLEEALRLVLKSPGERRRRVRLPVSKARGGLLPGVDLNDTSALLDRMDDRG